MQILCVRACMRVHVCVGACACVCVRALLERARAIYTCINKETNTYICGGGMEDYGNA